MKKKILGAAAALILCGTGAYAQIDTTGIYGERKDTLKASIFTARQKSNTLSKGKEIRTEVINASGLCKLACCSLAESFENSASVTVGYSDAVTGARQIRLLGQSGVYTQMLDENRPVMRGLSAPWGLTFVPSQWLESIQIGKGAASVVNGVESMTGQINMEHIKPDAVKPLYVQASFQNDTKGDLNVVSAFPTDGIGNWNTVILAHVDGNFKPFDENGDGFMDDPMSRNFALGNRWLHTTRKGSDMRFGFRAIADNRNGGQMEGIANPWTTDIRNRNFNGYFKLGVPLDEDGCESIGVIADYTFQRLDSSFGNRYTYNAGQHSAFLNLLYKGEITEEHHYSFGVSEMLDAYDESFYNAPQQTLLSDTGFYGEYTYMKEDETLTFIAGFRGDYYNEGGFKFSPRLTLKWAPVEQLVFRANGGRGIRNSTPLIDNIGVLSSAKTLRGDLLSHPLESSWTYGANVTWYLPFDKNQGTYLSIDYFSTRFTEQMMVDYTKDMISFYALSSMEGGESYTNNLQVDFSSEIFKGFTATLTGRFTDAKQTLVGQSGDEKPMTSRYKGVLNLQYITPKDSWIFDFTASVNGPCKLWDFMEDDYSPVYPLLYAQVTKRFKKLDLYFGGENLTNFKQPDPILGANDPYGSSFDASCIWGPLSGIKIYGGLRYNLL